MNLDSAYEAIYDAASQTVDLHDVVNDSVYVTIGYHQFAALTNNWFPVERAHRVLVALVSGRPMVICWVDQKVGSRPTVIPERHQMVGRALSVDNIELEEALAKDPLKQEELIEHRNRFMSSLKPLPGLEF